MEVVMESSLKAVEEAQRMELKYCEHCGGLWYRASGDEEVFCEKCKDIVAELPAPKKGPGRISLPVAQPTVVEDLEEWKIDELEFEATGGVA
jgi:phage FluMu protein Com